ncbi:lycopene cyclase domain-containing protein [Brevibacterium jeotgali]|uniref:Lycopene cyclase domain-containing protein n=1 Tax=Brevibacterium jeotgali TaxID=1262550 RepID=A0A2H1L817_9MICO|nr:lycopene cyclase domain-containing protein [Brevibacterium jeotgali]TWC03373.1 lycopene cyclase domain-containing protein [Brevibacterium jeotgali]SMY13036.1 lycopene cyclase domain-containing protein [Brevibacterium jeotgali]
MSYLALNAPFFAVAVAVLGVALLLRRVTPRRAASQILVSAVVLCALTAVFDNLMIYVGLFEYAEESLVGIRIGLAPLEDFAYPVVAAILLPSLRWLLFPAGVERGDRSTPSAIR